MIAGVLRRGPDRHPAAGRHRRRAVHHAPVVSRGFRDDGPSGLACGGQRLLDVLLRVPPEPDHAPRCCVVSTPYQRMAGPAREGREGCRSRGRRRYLPTASRPSSRQSLRSRRLQRIALRRRALPDRDNESQRRRGRGAPRGEAEILQVDAGKAVPGLGEIAPSAIEPFARVGRWMTLRRRHRPPGLRGAPA